MKRTLLIYAMSIASALGCWSQENYFKDIIDNGNNTPRVGFHIDWTLSEPSTNLNDMVSTYHSGSGFTAGAFYSIPIYKNMYIEPCLNFFYNTMLISQDVVENMQLGYPLTPEGSMRNSGISVPLVLGYRFDFSDYVAVSIYTGPQLNVGFSLKEHFKGDREPINLYKEGWHRCDLQLMIGLRLYYADNWFADICGGIGLTNMASGTNWEGITFRRNSFSVGVGYVF